MNKFQIGDTVRTADHEGWSERFCNRLGKIIDLPGMSECYRVKVFKNDTHISAVYEYTEERLTLVEQSDARTGSRTVSDELLKRIIEILPDGAIEANEIDELLHPVVTKTYLVTITDTDPESRLQEAAEWLTDATISWKDVNGDEQV